jgi:hypothetical protein
MLGGFVSIGAGLLVCVFQAIAGVGIRLLLAHGEGNYMVSLSEVNTHHCSCCGQAGVKDKFDYCYKCMMKWRKVYLSCLKYGWSKESAVKRADESYPRKYARDGSLLAEFPSDSVAAK